MTPLKPLFAALDRIATALEQLAPAVTQATRETHQVSHGRHERFGKVSIPFWSPTAVGYADIDRSEIETMKGDIKAVYEQYTPPNRPADPPPRPPGRSQG